MGNWISKGFAKHQEYLKELSHAVAEIGLVMDLIRHHFACSISSGYNGFSSEASQATPSSTTVSGR